MKQLALSALKWGFIGGLAIIIFQTIFFMLGIGMKGGYVGFLLYLPLIFTMIWGGITIRKENGGVLPFGRALLTIIIIALVGSVMLNIFVYRIWMAYIDAGLMEKIMRIAEDKIREGAEQRGLSDSDTDKQIAFARRLPYELIAYAMSLISSLIFSLIIAAFVARPDRGQIIKPAE
jgi:hypothetical protein